MILYFNKTFVKYYLKNINKVQNSLGPNLGNSFVNKKFAHLLLLLRKYVLYIHVSSSILHLSLLMAAIASNGIT